MREIDLDQFVLEADYVEGFSEHRANAGELALIYAVLPELLVELNLTQTKKE